MVTKILDRIAPKKENQQKKCNENIVQLDRPTLAYTSEDTYQLEIVWRNVILFMYLHVAGIYGLFLKRQTWSAVVLAWAVGFIMALGTTVGAHRLYTHRSFKANTKLRALLVFMQTIAVQNSMFEWVRDHRVHHKFTDTNADPHNSQRGFFFSHIGWLMCKKHPEVKKFGAKVEMSDLEADAIVMFQHKYYPLLALVFGFALPIWIGCYLGESFTVSWHGHIFRYIMGLHLVWMINSAAHLWGYKPFDKSMSSTDSIIIGTLGVGEGWHNYHHVFPWDYKAAELPTYWCNLSLAFLDFFAWIGWATDLKTVSEEMINARAARTGDGTRHNNSNGKLDGNNNEVKAQDEKHPDLWGWDDKQMTDEDRKFAKILYKCYD